VDRGVEKKAQREADAEMDKLTVAARVSTALRSP
jgi:hypothetical protein